MTSHRSNVAATPQRDTPNAPNTPNTPDSPHDALDRRVRTGLAELDGRRHTGQPQPGHAQVSPDDPDLLALEATALGRHAVYNLGSGTGYSNREVLDTCQEVTGHEIPVRTVGRRPGDPAVLVSSADAIRADLGWQAELDLRSMAADAWTLMQLLATTG